MKFYRRLTQIKAISFDLDDTLYNNRPVMQGIEEKMSSYFVDKFSQLLPELPAQENHFFNRKFWAGFRQQSINAQSDIAHDVVQIRFETYRLGLIAYNFSEHEAKLKAQAALDYFIELRSDFTVPQASFDLLKQLSQKYPLVSISNGNVDTKALGLDHYFTHIYHAGFQTGNTVGVVGGCPDVGLFKHKPDSTMFHQVCQQLDIQPHELLHVGDCGNADIHGALTAGCQAAYLPQYGVGKSLKQLPHIALNQVSDLKQLLE